MDQIEQATKKCSKCQEHKTFDLFSKWKNGLFGLDNTCKECRSKARKENRYDLRWTIANPEKRRAISKRCRDNRRIECLRHYSGGDPVCSCCGERHLEFLAIDHKEGGGADHRRDLKNVHKSTIYIWLKKNNYPDGFRVLCHNCNQSRGYYGYCPHEKETNGHH